MIDLTLRDLGWVWDGLDAIDERDRGRIRPIIEAYFDQKMCDPLTFTDSQRKAIVEMLVEAYFAGTFNEWREGVGWQKRIEDDRKKKKSSALNAAKRAKADSKHAAFISEYETVLRQGDEPNAEAIGRKHGLKRSTAYAVARKHLKSSGR